MTLLITSSRKIYLSYVFKKEKYTFTYFIVFINNYIAFHILNRFEMLVEKYTSNII